MTKTQAIAELEQKQKHHQQQAEKLKHNVVANNRHEAAALAYAEAIAIVSKLP